MTPAPMACREQSASTGDIQSIILAVLERAPQWIRHDLASSDALIRNRAEEAMAAIIAQALRCPDRSGD